jgi:hypothetical protein
MKFKEEEVKQYEMFSVLGTENTKEDQDNVKLLEEEIIKQHIGFSRITFKEARDSIAKVHEGYALENHDGHQGDDTMNKHMYRINRLDKEGTVDYSLGRIVDYDVPLKRGGDSPIEVGNLSLISETMDKLYIMNTKQRRNEESLLRVILETITKFDMISRRQLLQDYNESTINKFKYYHTKDDIIPAVVLFEGTRAYQEFKSLPLNGLIAQLVYKYHIHFFFLKNEEGNYILLED